MYRLSKAPLLLNSASLLQGVKLMGWSKATGSLASAAGRNSVPDRSRQSWKLKVGKVESPKQCLAWSRHSKPVSYLQSCHGGNYIKWWTYVNGCRVSQPSPTWSQVNHSHVRWLRPLQGVISPQSVLWNKKLRNCTWCPQASTLMR